MAKKSFKQNPALQFISSADDTQNKQNDLQTDNTQYTDNTEYNDITDNKQYTNIEYTKHELKNKRLNLLLKPSILENISKIAHMKQTSVNDLINSILKDYTEIEEETISIYDKVFSKKL